MRYRIKVAAFASIIGILCAAPAVADIDGWDGPGWYLERPSDGKVALLDGPVSQDDCNKIRSSTGDPSHTECVYYASKPGNHDGGTSATRETDLDLVMACADSKGDAAIAACTRQIQDKNTTEDDLTSAYYNRGVHYMNKNHATRADLLQAVSDFTAAIRLDPKSGGTYYARGITYKALGDKTRSAADLADAAKLNQQGL